MDNIGMQDSLLSRFDLLFIVLDQVSISLAYNSFLLMTSHFHYKGKLLIHHGLSLWTLNLSSRHVDKNVAEQSSFFPVVLTLPNQVHGQPRSQGHSSSLHLAKGRRETLGTRLLHSWSFYLVDWTRTAEECTKMKNTRAKLAKHTVRWQRNGMKSLHFQWHISYIDRKMLESRGIFATIRLNYEYDVSLSLVVM